MLPAALCRPFVKLPAKRALLGCFDKIPTEDKMPTQMFHTTSPTDQLMKRCNQPSSCKDP